MGGERDGGAEGEEGGGGREGEKEGVRRETSARTQLF